MTLKEQLMEDMKAAMRAHESQKLDMVRLIRAAVQSYEIDHREAGEASDEQVQKIISTMVKQQQDALVDFKKADRQDLVEETESKIVILESYLPKQLSDAELQAIVAEVLAGAERKDFGPLMGQVMKKVAGRADGNRVTAMLKAALA